jgi:serine/threonine protein kinase/tetratricopeptide (TPR) repeat protein
VNEFAGTPRYRIVRRLGAGGMGVVYEAVDNQRGLRVALKTLAQANASALYRLKREFRSLVGLSHENLVTLHDLVCHEGTWFFTMDLVDGQPFLAYSRLGETPVSAATIAMTPLDGTTGDAVRHAPQNRRPVDTLVNVSRLRSTLRQLAAGIQALHEGGMLHRDLKPSNVLVTDGGHVAILDFGLVHDSNDVLERSIDAHVLGTPAYMAPEQAANTELGPACDWYAFGVMLYEALTGVVPFGGEVLHVLASKQVRPPPPPSHYTEGAPPDLVSLCMDLLERAPADRPTGEQVIERLRRRQSNAPPSLAPPRNVPLVGRERELDALERARQRADATGRPFVVHVSAPSGFGKSALIGHFLRAARDRGAAVLAGRCYPREAVPFGGFDALVDSLGRKLRQLPVAEATELLPRDVPILAQVFPTLMRADAVRGYPSRQRTTEDPTEQRRRAFGALKELLARIADRRPLVLFLDDIQWSDTDSADLAEEILSGADAPAVLLVLSSRTGEAVEHGLPAAVRRANVECEELVLGPLARDDARTLVGQLLEAAGARPSPGDPVVDVIVNEADGVPLFLEELVRYCRADGSAGDTPSLDAAFGHRIAALDDGAAKLLEVVAIASGPIDEGVACAAAALGSSAPRALAALTSAHLVRSLTVTHNSHAIDTTHDRIRETVEHGLSPQRQVQLHARIAEALARTAEPDSMLLAFHLEGAGATRAAAVQTRRAAERATENLAFDRAVRLYQHVLSLDPEGQGDHVEVEAALGSALAKAGRSAEAADAYLRAADAGHASAFDLRRLAAEHLLKSGRIERGLELVSHVLAEVGMELPQTPLRAQRSLRVQRVRSRWASLSFTPRLEVEIDPGELRRVDACWTVVCGLAMVDPVRSAELQERHLRLALRAGEPRRVVRAMAMEAAHLSVSGARAEARARRLLDRADTLLEEMKGDLYTQGVVASTRGLHAYLLGRWPEAFAETGRAEEIFRTRCVNVAWEAASTRRFHLVSMAYLGRLRQLANTAPQYLRDAEDRGDLYAQTTLAAGAPVFAWLVDDRVAAARDFSAECAAVWRGRNFQLQHELLAQGEGFIDLYEGRPDEAMARWNAIATDVQRSLIGRIQLMRLQSRAWRAHALLAGSDPDGVAKASAYCRRMRREKSELGDALALGLGAPIAWRSGERDQALGRLADAAAAFDAIGMHLHAAAARDRHGQALGGDEGRALCALAAAYFADEGASEPDRLIDAILPALDPPSR